MALMCKSEKTSSFEKISPHTSGLDGSAFEYLWIHYNAFVARQFIHNRICNFEEPYFSVFIFLSAEH